MVRMMDMLRILVADDDDGLRLSVASTLKNTRKFIVEEACDGLEAVEKVKSAHFDMVLLDVDMPKVDGLEALKIIKDHNPGIVVIIVTAYANIDNAVQAVKDGAYNYLSKPIQGENLLHLIQKAAEAQALISNIAASAPVLIEEGRKFIGNNHQMQRVYNIIHRLSKADTPVLIRGASGTGKELVARAIHFNSPRKDGKFVAINCSAIPETLFESELFGHEKGSFTGADQRKIGKFQFAEGGTLFLDEVGDLPPLMQVKLLRVLQEKVFTPVGSHREITTNTRIIAATNRPLEDMMKTGAFREDLFYRLNVIPIFLPSLMDRKDDLQKLVEIFIKKFNQSHHKKLRGITATALQVLKKYHWPGNIRELENVIEHCFIMENTTLITVRSLPDVILSATGVLGTSIVEAMREEADELLVSNVKTGKGEFRELNDVVSEDGNEDENVNGNGNGDDEDGDEGGDGDELDSYENQQEGSQRSSLRGVSDLDFNLQKELFEKEFIIKALKTFKGRINQTALHANIPKKTLLRKIEKYGIHPKDYA